MRSSPFFETIEDLLFLDLREEERDAGFSPVRAAAGDDAFGHSAIIARRKQRGNGLSLGRVGGQLSQLFAERFELRENGQILGAFLGITTNTFCSGTNIGHFDDSFR